MTKDEALTMALELLAVATYHSPDLQAKRTEVIDVGLKALSSGATVAQPQQEPQGKHTFYDANGNVVAHLDATAEITMDYAKPSVWAKAEQSPLNEQEPVAISLNTGTKQGVKWLKNVEHGESLYTSPPQRTWVNATWRGLTDEDFQPIVQKAMAYYGYNPEHSTLSSGAGFYVLVRNIEAKLKAKNETAQN